jgi:hypothetical protein
MALTRVGLTGPMGAYGTFSAKAGAVVASIGDLVLTDAPVTALALTDAAVTDLACSDAVVTALEVTG